MEQSWSKDEPAIFRNRLKSKMRLKIVTGVNYYI